MKLSIIIPAYNVGSLIRNCIYSCLNQDLPTSDFEIIIVDDGSKDNTYECACELAAQYGNVFVYTQKNQGQSGARNNALDKAKGEYVWFVDADDYIVPNCLNTLYNKAKDNDLDALYFVLQRHYEGESEPAQQFDCRQSSLPVNKILNGVDAVIGGYNPCSSCAAIYRLSKLNKENLRFMPRIFRQDVEFTYRSIPTFERIMFVPEVYYVYYTHSGTVTTSNDKAIVVRRMIGDGYVARTCKRLSEKYETNNLLSKTFKLRYQGVMLGAVMSLWSNRKNWRANGANKEILDKYEELGVYPVRPPYKNIKHQLLYTFLLNHRSFFD